MAVFSLNEVKVEQVKNIQNNNFTSWPESANYGYFGGGSPPITNLISRLDFSNETASDPGKNLPVTLGYAGGTASSFYGYFGGGETPDAISTITRLDFSNETLSNPGNNLPSARVMPAVVANNSYGYFAGGKLTPPATSGDQTSAIIRLDFSNETVSNPGKTLPAARWRASAVSSSSYGYFGLGSAPPTTSYLSTIVRIDFSNETSSLPGKNLPSVSTSDAGHAIFNINYGYFSGGDSGGGGTSAIARLEFSNELVIDPGTRLPTVLMGGSTVQSSSFGYIGGGYKSGFRSSFIRTDFSTETISVPSSKLSSAKERTTSFSGGASVYRNARGFGTYGYFGGGYSGSPQPPPFTKNLVCRLDFSTENFTPIGNLGSSRYNGYGFSNNNYGYFAGGQSTPGVIYSLAANKVEFVSNTISATNPIGVARAGGASFSSKYCGYAIGGSPTTSTVSFGGRKYDFSTGSSAATKSLTFGIYNGYTGIESGSYGYITNGSTSTSFYRFDFSNETVSNPGNKLPTAFQGSAGISHTSRGYFIGSSSPGVSKSTIARLEFSNETASNPGKNLPTPKESISATQSELYGYLVGGAIPVAPPTLKFDEISNVTRFDFSTEDVTDISPTYPTPLSNSATCTNHNKYNLYS